VTLHFLAHLLQRHVPSPLCEYSLLALSSAERSTGGFLPATLQQSEVYEKVASIAFFTGDFFLLRVLLTLLSFQDKVRM
jgi:hypothetical protein